MLRFLLLKSLMTSENRWVWMHLGLSAALPSLFLLWGINATTFFLLLLLPPLLGLHFYHRSATVNEMNLDSFTVRSYPYEPVLMAGVFACLFSGGVAFWEIYQSGAAWFIAVLLALLWTMIAFWVAVSTAVHLVTPEDLEFG